MARTWHHDEKRFHPWKNPRSRDCVKVRFCEARSTWYYTRTGFHYVNYSKSPSWWVRLMMERPLRREVHMMETKLRGSKDLELVWPEWKRPHVYYW